MSRKSLYGFLIVCCLFFSCKSGSRPFDPVPPRLTPFSPVVKETVPVLRVLNHKNRDDGAALAPWLRSYLRNGLAEAEALPAYKDSYLFIARIYNSNLMVVNHWLKNFSLERDVSRLVAERIRVRMDRDLVIEPNDWYGPAYVTFISAAYRTSFWGGQRLDDSWVRGSQTIQDQDGEIQNVQYWGFILVAIPKDTLEIQISTLLRDTKGTGTKEQNARFEEIKGHFFDQF